MKTKPNPDTSSTEEATTATAEPPASAPETAAASENTADTLINRMRVKREEVEPPKFLDESDFVGGGDEGDEEEEAPDTDEPLTEDDKSNLEYLDYSDEHRTTATFLIMTFDRMMAMGCGFMARESGDEYRKFETKAAISPDYLDVSAALVKKYQARMSLEYILLGTMVAIYAPNLTMAYSKGKVKKAQEQAQKNA